MPFASHKHSSRSPLLALLLCLPLLLGQQALAETITLTGGKAFLESSYGEWLERVYREAFRRLGYDFVMAPYPAQRALTLADSGKVDGQIERGHDFNLEHPNLLRVEEPSATESFSAFSLKPGIALDGWESLRGTSYSVVARRGVGKAAETLSTMVGSERLLYVERPEQALGMLELETRRVDLYIDYEPMVEETLRKMRSQQPDAYATLYKVGTLEHSSQHAFLHKKHAALVPKLEQVLKDMKREGLFEQYRKEQAAP